MTMKPENVIRFEHVRKAYGDTIILPDFNLEIGRGEFLTVIGSSGSGKTTMLKMINGLILPDAGSIYVDDKPVCDTDLIALRRNIGYVIQNIGLFPHMTVAQNIAYVPGLSRQWDRQEAREMTRSLVEVVGMDRDMLSRYPSELSGGQQQRVGIARALAANPDILLMDEPFGAVDEITRHQLQDEIKSIHGRRDVTIVFVTHDIREALKLGTRVLVMHDGEIMQCAAPEEIEANPANEFVKQLVSME